MFEIAMQQNAGVLAVQPGEDIDALVMAAGAGQSLGQTTDGPPTPKLTIGTTSDCPPTTK